MGKWRYDCDCGICNFCNGGAAPPDPEKELIALCAQLTTLTRERDAAVERLKSCLDMNFTLVGHLNTANQRLGEAEMLLRDFQKVKMNMDNIHRDGLPAKYWEAYDGMKTVYPKVEKYFSTFLTPPAEPHRCGPFDFNLPGPWMCDCGKMAYKPEPPTPPEREGG